MLSTRNIGILNATNSRVNTFMFDKHVVGRVCASLNEPFRIYKDIPKNIAKYSVHIVTMNKD